MNKSILLAIITMAASLSSNSSFAAPSITLPINLNDAVQLSGPSTFTTTNGTASFHEYSAFALNMSVLVIQFDYVSGDDEGFGFGAVQLYSGTNRIENTFGAASMGDWFNYTAPNTWVEADYYGSVWYNFNYRYMTLNPLVAGNLDEPGAPPSYDFYGANTGNTFLYYVGFETPIDITSVKLGDFSNGNTTFDVTFYGYGESIQTAAVPEPLSLVLVGLSAVGLIRKRQKQA